MNDKNLPGRGESYWIASTPQSDYPALEGEITVDIAVVGGGVAGLSAAFAFKEAGMRVAVLEAGRLLEQVTGNSTAKRFPIIDPGRFSPGSNRNVPMFWPRA